MLSKLKGAMSGAKDAISSGVDKVMGLEGLDEKTKKKKKKAAGEALQGALSHSSDKYTAKPAAMVRKGKGHVSKQSPYMGM